MFDRGDLSEECGNDNAAANRDDQWEQQVNSKKLVNY
jgi:hypothetical protein